MTASILRSRLPQPAPDPGVGPTMAPPGAPILDKSVELGRLSGMTGSAARPRSGGEAWPSSVRRDNIVRTGDGVRVNGIRNRSS